MARSMCTFFAHLPLNSLFKGKIRTRLDLLSIPQSGEKKMSKHLGRILGCKYKTIVVALYYCFSSHTCFFVFCFCFLEMPLFPEYFCTICACSLYGEYVVLSFLPSGVFLPCGHRLDFLHQLIYIFEFNQSIQSI